MLDFVFLPVSALSHAVYVVALAVFWTWALWVLFLAVMNLKRARDDKVLPRFAWLPGVFTLYVGWLLDFLVNVVVLSVAMLEVPRELTVTARLKRHRDDTSWRGTFARWIAANLLDPFDPSGRHV